MNWFQRWRYRRMMDSLGPDNRIMCYQVGELCFLTDIKKKTSRKIKKSVVSQMMDDNRIEEISRGLNSIIYKIKGIQK